MPNMKLKDERHTATLILKGLVEESEELRKIVYYRLTPTQLKMLERVAANIKVVQAWQQ